MKSTLLPAARSSSITGLSPAFWLKAAVGVMFLHALLIVATFRDYGIAWDEPSMHEYGRAVVRFYTSGGVDRYAQECLTRSYGSFFQLIAAGVEKASGLEWFQAMKLASACMSWVGVYAILRAGWIAFSPPVGVLAAVFLLTTPVYYGHAFINPKDLPFAALTMLSLAYMLRLAAEYPVPRWSTALKLAFAMGAAMGTRVGGLLLYGFLGVTCVMAVGIGCRLSGFRASIRPTLTLAAQVGVIFLLAWGTMIAVWPFGWTDPLRAPFIALDEFAKYPWPGNVFYDGKLLKCWDLPWTYVPNLVVRTLPEHVLLGLLAGLASLVLLRGFKLSSHRLALIGSVIGLAGFIWPLGIIWDLDSNLYDGYRQVLFTIPPLVLVSAAGAWSLIGRVKGGRAQAVVLGLFGLGAIATVCDMIALHPYEYIYFNRTVGGGLAAANQRYDLDYWATALREAAEWAEQSYHPTPVKPVLYSMNDGEPEMLSTFLRPRSSAAAEFQRATPEQKPTLLFLIRRERQTSEPTEGRILHVVRRQGVPLVDVVEVR